MVRRAADQGSAFALLEHADEEGFIENIDEVLEQLSEDDFKPAKAAVKAKQKQQAAAKAAAAHKTANNRAGNTQAAGTSRAAAQQNDSAGNKARAEEYYRAFEHVFKDASTGEVVLRFHKTNIVRIKPNGDVILTSGGWFTFTTLSAMNDALLAMNMKVHYKGAVSAGMWAVTDDAAHVWPFQDNMVIPASRAEHKGRGAAVLHAYAGGAEVPVYATKAQAAGLVAHSNAAQAASRPAAAASGLGRGAAGGCTNMAAHHASYASTVQPQKHQQQYSAAAAMQHRKAAEAHAHATQHIVRKTVHEQLQEAVEQLGLEDELAGGDEHLCVVCLENQRDVVLVPCGHMVLCRFCCAGIINNSSECPVCRETIVDHCTLNAHDV